MKFLFIIESLAVAGGGPPRVAGTIASELVARGHEVTIGTLNNNMERVPMTESVNVVNLGDSSFGPWRWVQAAKTMRRLFRGADVIIVSGIWGPVDGLALRFANPPAEKLFIRVCGMLEQYILRRNSWKKLIAKTIYTDHNLKRARCLLVNTSIEAERVAKLGFGSAIKVIPNGVKIPPPSLRVTRKAAIETLHLDLAEDQHVLLYLGRLHPKKGLHLLLPTFARFHRTNPAWHLVIAGEFSDETYQATIKKILVENGNHGIHFTGEVAGNAKTACFSLANAFILPSFSEGFPNAVVEALSWGIPSLVTPGCNFPTVGEAKAGLQIDASEESVYEGLKSLTDEKNLEFMGANARTLIEQKYQLSNVVDLYENLAGQLTRNPAEIIASFHP